MRYRNKTTSMRVILRLIVGLTMIIFVLSLTNALNAEDVTSHKGRFWRAEPVEDCGRVLENGHFELIGDLTCPNGPYDPEDPAITINGPAKLNLNGYTLSGNGDNVCIRIEENGAWVWNGTVTKCSDGVVIAGTGRHKVFRIKSMDNEKGIRIRSNDNKVKINIIINNDDEGIKVEQVEQDDDTVLPASNNLISSNSILNNGKEGIIVEQVEQDDDTVLPESNNLISSNIVINNGKEGVKIDWKGNIVHKNFIKQNNKGIRIRSNDNEVKKNIIINNVEEGIRVDEDKERNHILYNFVLGNELDLKDKNDDCGSNWWYKNFAKTGEPDCTLCDDYIGQLRKRQ